MEKRLSTSFYNKDVDDRVKRYLERMPTIIIIK